MIGTTEMIIVGVIIFLLFGGVVFKRLIRQFRDVKEEVSKIGEDEPKKKNKKQPSEDNN